MPTANITMQVRMRRGWIMAAGMAICAPIARVSERAAVALLNVFLAGVAIECRAPKLFRHSFGIRIDRAEDGSYCVAAR